MGLFKQKSKDGNIKIKMLHESGLPTVGKIPVTLTLDEANNKVIINVNPKHTNGPAEFSLDISKIVSTEQITDEAIKERANATKNAIVGGVLLGPVGAVVGATSAKYKKQTIFYRSIKYVSDDIEKEMIFKFAGDLNEKRFFDELNKIIKPEIFDNVSEKIEL